MRILYISHSFPRPGHQTEATFNGHQIDALSQEHEVRAIVPVSWPERLRDWRREGAGKTSTRGKVIVNHPTYWYPPGILRPLYGAFYLRSIRGAVKTVCRDFRPDAILACWAHPDGWAAVRLGQELGIPVVIKVIGSDVLINARDTRRREKVAEAVCAADGVVAVSQDLAEHVRQLGVDASRVHVVSEGTLGDLFGPGDPSEAAERLGLGALEPSIPRLLFVGNLLFSKGVGVLLESCGILRERGIRFRCYIVGRGRDQEMLRGMAARVGPELIHFAGSSPQEKLADWYRMSDLVLLPSFSEGIPNVLREAMMCGRRFVATRVGGIPEITRPGVGWLVEKGKPNQLADAIVAALNSGSTRDSEAVALSASKEVNISWRQSAEAVSKVIGNAMTQQRGCRDVQVA